jgi:hypothetical protein
LTEEIDGSAFVNCPLIAIQVATGSLNFKVEGNLLVTPDGTEIVRCFGLDREIVVGNKVKVLGKSCFEGCGHLDRIDFEIGSELERIGPAALRGCESLVRIAIPPSVTIIEKTSFEGCDSLESCLMYDNSSLVMIGVRAFANCISLRAFSIPRLVGKIDSNCFRGCVHLYRFHFKASESFKTVIGDRSLDDALDEFGVNTDSSLFRIEVEDRRVELQFAGWKTLTSFDGDLHVTLVRDPQ